MITTSKMKTTPKSGDDINKVNKTSKMKTTLKMEIATKNYEVRNNTYFQPMIPLKLQMAAQYSKLELFQLGSAWLGPIVITRLSQPAWLSLELSNKYFQKYTSKTYLSIYISQQLDISSRMLSNSRLSPKDQELTLLQLWNNNNNNKPHPDFQDGMVLEV